MYAVSTQSFSGDVLLHESIEYFESIENAKKYYDAIVEHSGHENEVHIYACLAKDSQIESMIENAKNYGY